MHFKQDLAHDAGSVNKKILLEEFMNFMFIWYRIWKLKLSCVWSQENGRLLILSFSASYTSSTGQESWRKISSAALTECKDACNFVIVCPTVEETRSDVEGVHKILLASRANKSIWCHQFNRATSPMNCWIPSSLQELLSLPSAEATYIFPNLHSYPLMDELWLVSNRYGWTLIGLLNLLWYRRLKSLMCLKGYSLYAGIMTKDMIILNTIWVL